MIFQAGVRLGLPGVSPRSVMYGPRSHYRTEEGTRSKIKDTCHGQQQIALQISSLEWHAGGQRREAREQGRGACYGVDWPVIVGFPDHIEDQVSADEIAASKPVVHVDPSPWPVVHHIVGDVVVAGDSLEVRRGLLRKNTVFVHVIPGHLMMEVRH